jgi:hypothetical protein
MAPRKNRRLLVAVTYAVMLALTETVLGVPYWGNRIGIAWLCAGVAFYLVCSVVFGKLVKQTGPLDIRGGGLTSLGLVPRRRDMDEPDERDVAIRNAACFQAYRVLALYSIVIWLARFLSFDLSVSVAVKVLELLTMPLLTMAITLPQAIILWTERDVPEEARGSQGLKEPPAGHVCA